MVQFLACDKYLRTMIARVATLTTWFLQKSINMNAECIYPLFWFSLHINLFLINFRHIEHYSEKLKWQSAFLVVAVNDRMLVLRSELVGIGRFSKKQEFVDQQGKSSRPIRSSQIFTFIRWDKISFQRVFRPRAKIAFKVERKPTFDRKMYWKLPT